MKKEINFNILTSTFLLNLQISSNQKVMMSSFFLLFDIITDFFQLFIIEINNCSIDVLLIQACIMCIKCA